MWNKRFNIVIYYLLPFYLVTKAVCPLWILLTAPHQWHLLPPSMLIELIDWPGAMPTTHAPDIDLVITFRASHPVSLNTTHVRTCARLSSSTCGSLRLSLMLASRLLADEEKPSVIPSSLQHVQRIIFIILSSENSECHCCLWLYLSNVYWPIKLFIVLVLIVVLSVFFCLTLRFYWKLLTEYVYNLPKQAPRVLW